MITKSTERLASHVLLVFLSVLALAPLTGLLLVAFDGSGTAPSGIGWPSRWTLSNFSDAWKQAQLGTALVNSFVVAIFSVVGTTLFASLSGYAFARLRFRFKNQLFVLFVAGLVVPNEAMILPLYYDLRQYLPFLFNTYFSVALPQIGAFLAFATYVMRNAFAAIPASIVEAARMDGASTFRIFRTILFPLARPSAVALSVLTFLWSWNGFLLPLVMFADSPNKQTAPLTLFSFQGQHTTNVVGLASASMIVTLPIIVIYLFFQRQIITGMLRGAMR